MNDGDRLWRAILHRPHSRHLRQVYADWLEEHGDPRSEFIRLQSRTVPEDPAREAEVLRAHELEWLGPMAGHLRDWGFANGLIEWVCVGTPVFLAHAEKWVRRPGLLGVHLRRMRGHVADVAACPALARLPYLFLGDNDLTTDDVRTLLASRYIKSVRTLFLQSNRIDNDGFTAIMNSAVLSRLRELSLSNNNLLPVLPTPAGGPLHRLRTIHLAHDNLDGDSLGGVLAPAAFPALREAHVMLNATDPGGLATLVGAPAFARLRAFTATLREGSGDDLAGLAGSPHVRGLRRLALDFYQSDPDPGVEALAASGNLSRLRELTLTSAVRRPETLAALGRSRAFPRLRSLSVSRNVWADASPAPEPLSAFLGGPLVRRLHTLALQGWPLDDDCVRALGAAGPLAVRRLHLSTVPASASAWNDLPPGTLGRLARLLLNGNPPGVLAALPCPRLEAFSLGGFGPADADALTAFPALTRLRIGDPDDPAGVFQRLTASPHAGRWLSLSLGSAFTEHAAGFDGSPFVALAELIHDALDAPAVAALADWPGLSGLRRLRLGRLGHRDDSVRVLAAGSHWGATTRVVMDDQGGISFRANPERDAALRARLGGRVAFDWRASPRGVIMGGWPHDDT